MKLGAIYTVFNGMEHLEKSIEQIYPYVDEILICEQIVSNKGEVRPYTYELDAMYALLDDNKIYLETFTPDLKLQTKVNERVKHNLAINRLKAMGCTHFILLATDHYYLPEEFLRAKIKAEKYDVTLTQMYTYFKKPQWRLDPPETYWMPFICKIYPNTEFTQEPFKDFHTDPSVRINTRNSIYGFRQDEIMMHHYSAVRLDINNKLKNAAASIRWTPEMIKGFQDEFENYDIKENPGVKYFGGRKIKVVEDIFGLNPIFDKQE